MARKRTQYAIFFMSEEGPMAGLDLKIVGPFATESKAMSTAELILRKRGLLAEDETLADYQDACSPLQFAHVYPIKAPEDVQ